MRILWGLVLACLAPAMALAQEAKTSELYAQILRADALLFERGFNDCDPAALDQSIAADLSFFHDVNGTVSGKAEFLKGLNQSICSTPQRKPIRKLLPETMEVFPLRNEGKLYGAIQNAVHEFYIREPGKDLYKTNVARISNVWLLRDGRWQLKTSLSYDHYDPRVPRR